MAIIKCSEKELSRVVDCCAPWGIKISKTRKKNHYEISDKGIILLRKFNVKVKEIVDE